jgi:Domain of unknown function (DUF3850)
MMAEHHLKTLPDYWDAVERGDKDFEVRRDDRGFQKGDVLLLEKFNPNGGLAGAYDIDYTAPGRKPKTLRRKIKYILTGGQFGIEPGYVVIGTEPV